MNKLTAELLQQLKSAAQEEIMCREASDTSGAWQDLASPENILLLVEIALPVLEQQEAQPKIDNDSWIEWKGGSQPVDDEIKVDFMFRSGDVFFGECPEKWVWEHHKNDVDIISYRVIENDGREG